MILHTAYFPSISWIEQIDQGALIERFENYQKQTSRNRCRIMTAAGVESLIVPVVHGHGTKIAIQDAQIDYSMCWQRVHARAVMSAYRSSAYWEHFAHRVMPLFELRHKYLLDMNNEITERLLSILKIARPLEFTAHFVGAAEPPETQSEQYYQVFAEKHPFARDLSVLDAIFCEGRLPSAE